METRANFVLIGAFTVAVIVGAFMLVFWFSGVGRVAQRNTYQVLFSGSVSGLSRGGAVLFNGLRVGEVTQMDFVPNDPGRVVALIKIESRIPIKVDTTARLELQGLTGAAAIALKGGAPDAAPLVGKDGAPPIIVAEPSQIQNLLESVQNISAKADSFLTKADKILTDNSEAISDTLRNIAAFSKALGDSSTGISGALTGLADIGRKIGPLSDGLQKLSDDTDKLVVAISPEKVRRVVDDVASFTANLGDANGPAQSLLNDAATLAKRLNETSGRLDSALADIDKLVKSFDTKKVASFMDGADAVGETLRENRGNLDRILKNSSELAAKLNDSADKLDGLMTSLQAFVGSPDVKGPLAQVGDAAKSVRQLADDLNARTKDIAAGLTRFTSSGLREYEALAIDGRRTINDFDRVVRGFERNPNQVIFGAKPALPDYHGGN
jgi:phospholipid/cholesterol/gamma-HCH transport system substrate-binding protein